MNRPPPPSSPPSRRARSLAASSIPTPPTPGLQTRLLLKERNGVLLPSDHPLAGRAGLRLRDLAATPFVLFPRSHNPGFYDRTLAAFAAAGISPRIAEEVWPRANAVGLVRAGLGATFMAQSESKLLPPDVVYRPLRGRRGKPPRRRLESRSRGGPGARRVSGRCPQAPGRRLAPGPGRHKKGRAAVRRPPVRRSVVRRPADETQVFSVATPVVAGGVFCLKLSVSPSRTTSTDSPSLISPRRIASASGSSR